MTNQKSDYAETTPLDEAARVGWLYYVGGMTQDQIAKEMGISRQRAQRLVSRAVAEGLIRFRLEHRLSSCLELESALTRRFGLGLCRIAPSLGPDADPTPGIAPLVAVEMERVLSSDSPSVIALGTGRTLRAAVEQLHAMESGQHKLVSLNGNISPDGTASHYDVIMRMADRVRIPHFPMPFPAFAASPEERELFNTLGPMQRTIALAKAADVAFVGVGQLDDSAPIFEDGFLSQEELVALRDSGATGEIVGWIYDEAGQYLDFGPNLRNTGVRIEPETDQLVVATAAGKSKVPAMRAAISGNIVNGLITDEATAIALLG